MKYYSLKRPILPGGYPKTEAVKEIVNFAPAPQYCKEIDAEAYGYLQCSAALSRKEADEYELIAEGSHIYWCVITSINNNGKRSAMISKTIRCAKQPEDVVKDLSNKQVAHRWFISREIADRFIKTFLSEQNKGENL